VEHALGGGPFARAGVLVVDECPQAADPHEVVGAHVPIVPQPVANGRSRNGACRERRRGSVSFGPSVTTEEQEGVVTEFETILLERKGGADGKGGVGWITLNRPKALNALNAQVLDDVVAALDELEADDSIGAVVITGSEKAF